MEQQYDYTQRQALLSPPDVRDYKGVACVTEQQLPKTFELTKRGDIKSQGSTGSCVAHSLAAVAEYFNIQETGKYEAMSTGYIYGNRRNTSWKGVGMYVNTALASLRHYGTTKASDWNNNNEVPKAIELFEADCAKYQQQAYENRITQYYRLYDVASMKAALYQGHPIVFVLVFRTGMEIKDGVWLVDEKSAKTGGSHCMWIYGWDERGWKVANSWGCYDEQTEVLTKNGFKKFAECLEDDEFATLNSEGILEYQKATDFTNAYYNGDMYNFKSSKVDLCVTPNHNMYYAPIHSDKYVLKQA